MKHLLVTTVMIALGVAQQHGTVYRSMLNSAINTPEQKRARLREGGAALPYEMGELQHDIVEIGSALTGIHGFGGGAAADKVAEEEEKIPVGNEEMEKLDKEVANLMKEADELLAKSADLVKEKERPVEEKVAEKVEEQQEEKAVEEKQEKANPAEDIQEQEPEVKIPDEGKEQEKPAPDAAQQEQQQPEIPQPPADEKPQPAVPQQPDQPAADNAQPAAPANAPNEPAENPAPAETNSKPFPAPYIHHGINSFLTRVAAKNAAIDQKKKHDEIQQHNELVRAQQHAAALQLEEDQQRENEFLAKDHQPVVFDNAHQQAAAMAVAVMQNRPMPKIAVAAPYKKGQYAAENRQRVKEAHALNDHINRIPFIHGLVKTGLKYAGFDLRAMMREPAAQSVNEIINTRTIERPPPPAERRRIAAAQKLEDTLNNAPGYGPFNIRNYMKMSGIDVEDLLRPAASAQRITDLIDTHSARDNQPLHQAAARVRGTETDQDKIMHMKTLLENNLRAVEARDQFPINQPYLRGPQDEMSDEQKIALMRAMLEQTGRK